MYVATANALLGDSRGTNLLRAAVIDGPPLVVAHGLAALQVPVCPLIEEQLPDEWATYIKKTVPPPIEPGTFALSRELEQRETRLRLLQLMREGTDGACLAFVTDETHAKDASPEEHTLAKAILGRSMPSPTPEPTLASLDRDLRSTDVRVRLAALRMLARRRDKPAARFRAALEHSDFCESRLLAGATLEEADKAPGWEGCLPENLAAVYTALLAARSYVGAAALLRKLGGNDIEFIEHLREWLVSRRAAFSTSE